MAINNSSSQFNELAASLVALFELQQGSLKANDVISISYNSESNTSYSINGVQLATDQPADLFKLFLNSWIGRVPPSSDFRDAILGKIDASGLQGKLATITPSNERITTIESWIAAEEPEEPEAVAEAPVEVAATEVEEAASNTATATDSSGSEGTTAEASATLVASAATTTATPADDTAPPPPATEIPVAAAEDSANFEEEEEPVEAVSLDMILALKDYTTATLRQVYKSIKYPKSALRRGYEGQVRLSLKVDRDGNLIEANATEESKHSSLNKAALKAVQKAAPFATVPEAIQDEPLELTFPVTFRLQ